MTRWGGVVFLIVWFFPGTSGGETPPVASPKTVITSREMRVTRRGEALEFVGDVVLRRGNDVLTADRLMTQEKNTVAEAWGNVHLLRRFPLEKGEWEAWGDHGVYNTESSSGALWGVSQPARATRGSEKDVSGGRLSLESTEIIFFEVGLSSNTLKSFSLNMAPGTGGVYMKSDEEFPLFRKTEVWADHAFFDGNDGWLSLEGAFPSGVFPIPGSPPPALDRPFARQTTAKDVREIRGERILFHSENIRLIVKGRALGKLLFNPSDGIRQGSETTEKGR